MMELLSGAVLSAFEGVLNRVIALDPAAAPRLRALAGTRVLVESTLPAMRVSIQVHEQGVLLGTGADGTADAIVRGPASALLELLLAGSGKLSLYGKDVKVRGDLEKVQRLQHLLLDLRIDWEYELSKVIGDVPTQGLADLLRGGLDTLRKSRGSLRMDLDEYLHEEQRLFPGRPEMDAFHTQLHKLRLDLDRLAARLDLAASKLTSQPLGVDLPTRHDE